MPRHWSLFDDKGLLEKRPTFVILDSGAGVTIVGNSFLENWERSFGKPLVIKPFSLSIAGIYTGRSLSVKGITSFPLQFSESSTPTKIVAVVVPQWQGEILIGWRNLRSLGFTFSLNCEGHPSKVLLTKIGAECEILENSYDMEIHNARAIGHAIDRELWERELGWLRQSRASRQKRGQATSQLHKRERGDPQGPAHISPSQAGETEPIPLPPEPLSPREIRIERARIKRVKRILGIKGAELARLLAPRHTLKRKHTEVMTVDDLPSPYDALDLPPSREEKAEPLHKNERKRSVLAPNAFRLAAVRRWKRQKWRRYQAKREEIVHERVATAISKRLELLNADPSNGADPSAGWTISDEGLAPLLARNWQKPTLIIDDIFEIG